MTEPHPQRCEMCKKEIKECPLWEGHLVEDIHDIPDTHPAIALINKIGCASHSDAAKESSDVLDELDELRHYANGEYKEADVSDNEREMRIHLEYENRIWGIMKKLRQQQKERERR